MHRNSIASLLVSLSGREVPRLGSLTRAGSITREPYRHIWVKNVRKYINKPNRNLKNREWKKREWTREIGQATSRWTQCGGPVWRFSVEPSSKIKITHTHRQTQTDRRTWASRRAWKKIQELPRDYEWVHARPAKQFKKRKLCLEHALKTKKIRKNGFWFFF